MWGGVILFGIVPTIIYIGIGLYILNLEHIKKRPGYKLPALIYFISVPSLIVIAITLGFFMNYSTGQFENSLGTKPAGYEVYKFLVLKDIIPRSGQSLDETKTDLAKKKSEEYIKNENQTELIKIQIDKNKDYEDIVDDLKKDEIFTITLDKKDEFEDISVEITKKASERMLSNGENIDIIKNITSYSSNGQYGHQYGQLKYIKATVINYPSYVMYGLDFDIFSFGKSAYRYFKDIPKDFHLYSSSNNSKYILIDFPNIKEGTLLKIGANKPIENFFKQDLQHLRDKIDNNEITIKEAEKIATDKFAKEYLNYISFRDQNLEYSLTLEEKENIGILPEIINYDPSKSNKFQGLCATPEKYNNFFKNNYEEKNCEELYISIITDFDFEFINQIDDLQTRLEAKLKEPISNPFKTDEKYYALVIGNNNYEHLEKLDAAENDAVVIADVLTKKYGFEVDLLLNADYEKTVDTLFQITNKLKKNDNLLIYYAGHGELDKAENRGYWLPVDASYDQRSKWISNQRIVDRIKATKAKHVLLIADSCFSGTLMRSGITPEANEAIDAKYIERLKRKKTRLVITSGGNEPVVDSDGGDHSLFASKLIDTLKNNNNVINSQMLFENIRRYVVSNADQTPERAQVHKTGHDGGDFLFFPVN